jgi:nicotinamidase-related amidase
MRGVFRLGYPELSPRNKNLAPLADLPGVFDEDAGRKQVHPDLLPAAAGPVVVKRRVGASGGSGLDAVLRAMGVDRLVVAGTSGVILSTVGAASDLDFAITVRNDACADPDPAVHHFLVEKIFPRQRYVRRCQGMGLVGRPVRLTVFASVIRRKHAVGSAA